MDKPKINNLIAKVQGRDLTLKQCADATRELNKMILYTEELEQLILSDVGSSLPNVYENEHNSARIKFYQHLAKTMKVNVHSVRHIFNEGCDWYKSLI
jgi:hypothetical protein